MFVVCVSMYGRVCLGIVMCTCVCLCMGVYVSRYSRVHMNAGSCKGQKESVRVSGVTGGFEPPQLSLGTELGSSAGALCICKGSVHCMKLRNTRFLFVHFFEA